MRANRIYNLLEKKKDKMCTRLIGIVITSEIPWRSFCCLLNVPGVFLSLLPCLFKLYFLEKAGFFLGGGGGGVGGVGVYESSIQRQDFKVIYSFIYSERPKINSVVYCMQKKNKRERFYWRWSEVVKCSWILYLRWKKKKQKTRASVCKTLCPQLPDSNTARLQNCLLMTVTTVQIYEMSMLIYQREITLK